MKRFLKNIFPYLYVGSFGIFVLANGIVFLKIFIYWIHSSSLTLMQVILNNKVSIIILISLLSIFLILHIIAKFTLKSNRYSNRRK